MVNLVVIEKNGDVKNTKMKTFNINNLYKKCGFQNANNFEKRHTWKINDFYISIYSKDVGRGGTENKYDLPPPLDASEILYFGKIVLIKHNEQELNENNCCDLQKNEWGKIYEQLFGGFEDLGENDSSEESDDIPDELKTKEGYLKDGFVIGSDEEDSDLESIDNLDSDNEEEEEEGDVMGEESDFNSEDDDDEVGSEYNSYSSDEGDLRSELSEESYYSDSD